jgi:hypothetical protein
MSASPTDEDLQCHGVVYLVGVGSWAQVSIASKLR